MRRPHRSTATPYGEATTQRPQERHGHSQMACPVAWHAQECAWEGLHSGMGAIRVLAEEACTGGVLWRQGNTRTHTQSHTPTLSLSHAHTHTHTHTHTRVSACMYACAHKSMHVRACSHAQACLCVCVCVCMYVCVHRLWLPVPLVFFFEFGGGAPASLCALTACCGTSS